MTIPVTNSPAVQILENGLLDLRETPDHLKSIVYKNAFESPLLQIPAEIRLMIFEYATCDVELWIDYNYTSKALKWYTTEINGKKQYMDTLEFPLRVARCITSWLSIDSVAKLGHSPDEDRFLRGSEAYSVIEPLPHPALKFPTLEEVVIRWGGDSMVLFTHGNLDRMVRSRSGVYRDLAGQVGNLKEIICMAIGNQVKITGAYL
ncbi:hypothetical protein BU23DRAFT_634399 [Bimuria novae-zelandiae CBS 107.79]|uniref:Uncharacterized protein n=1 Tax=Bimuria novae-zelandiae CBS 107.79 TaxID=1447943 RepID=A0A6A5VDM9_9PLEO|nr:hypothetical protein BU23DRAFT_634399 [Bimuria novae-zelandiae CBS 107.79]